MKQAFTHWKRVLHGIILTGAIIVAGCGLVNAQAGIYITGPTRVCTGTPATFSADNELCTDWSWSEGDITPPSGPGQPTQTTITWNTAGSYRVTLTAACQTEFGGTSYPHAFLDVEVVDPPTNQFISTEVTAANAPAVNVTNTSATICLGNSLILVPPSGAVNCRWSTDYSAASGYNGTTALSGGRIQFFSQGYPNPSIRCTLNYELPAAAPCSPVPLVFTINLGTRAQPAVVTGTERFGAGPLTLVVQNHNPAYTYTWYEAATGAAYAYQGGPAFTTPSLSQGRKYYLGITSCLEEFRQEIQLVVHRVQIKIGGQVPAGPVALKYGSGLVLQADPNTLSQYTWRRDGQVVAGATGPQLPVFDPGTYTVRVAGGTGLDYESVPVEVLPALMGQSVNGQPLTFANEITVLKRNVTDPEQVLHLSPAERRQTVTYANGLGQPIQQLAVQAGPALEDIVQPFGYEGGGTATSTFLPFPVASSAKAQGEYEADPFTKLNAYYAPKGGLPSSTATLEASPLARPLEQTQTGTAWAGHPSSVSYAANAASEVRRWQGFDGSQWYAAGQLTKEISLDPDSRRTEVFKDQLGRTVLQRKVDGTQNFDTYTVYADAGYVQLVVPPAAVQALVSNGQWNIQDAGFKDRWLYQYTYDDQGRVIERKIPGAAPVYLVYDAFDRPVLVQDGAQRATSGGAQWLFTKFDAQNRPVVEGIWQDGRSRADVQDEVKVFTPIREYETRIAGGYTTGNTFPAVQDGVGGAVLLSRTFYDDYDLNADGTPDYAVAAEARLGTDEQPVQTTQARGLTTATQRRVVQPDGSYGGWLTTALLYDEYGNVVQKQSNNLLQASASLLDRTTLVYRAHGFVPQVLRSVKQQSYGAASPAVVRNRFAYDPAGHLLQTWQQHERNGTVEPELLLSSNRYEGLGELTQKKLHSRDQGTKFLQTEDFAYNLHGQLKSINSSQDLLVSNPENDLFALDIIREQVWGIGNMPRYDGLSLPTSQGWLS